MNKQELIEKYEKLEGVCKDPGAEIARLIFLEDLRGLDEPQKVTIPQYVADWIEYCKENHLTITGAFEPVSEHGIGLAETFKGSAYKCTRWALDNQNLFARAWLDGYTVEKEKQYTVKMRTTKQPLFYNSLEKRLFFSLGELATQFTFKQLEEAGFGEVFNSPLFEVEEVEG